MSVSTAAALACLMAASAAAQDTGASEAGARARFERFDADGNGWLAGREIEACACRGYDENRSGEITWIEFFAGEIGAAIDASQRDSSQRDASQRDARRPPHLMYRVGDRVEVQSAGTWYAGTISAVRGAWYAVRLHRGEASAPRWVTAAALRRAASAPRGRRAAPRRPGA